jgi:hypothetical protein
MNKNNLFYTGISGVVLFVVAALAGTILLKDYNPVTQFISESYAKDAPYGLPIRIFGFIPSGILLTLFSFLSYSRFPANSYTKSGFIALGVFYGIGTILTSIFPYDSYLNNDFSKVASSGTAHSQPDRIFNVCICTVEYIQYWLRLEKIFR